MNDVVFDRWNDIFGVEVSSKSIDIDFETELIDQNSLPSVYLRFSIRDGQSKFDISERSAGFRWFFCFLLFTQFRVSRRNSSALFLFDEPASNLHSRAQEQLLKSFSNISKDNNMVVYSTHSHYMINLKWLEASYIVVNDAIDYYEGIENPQGGRHPDTNIYAVRYRDFVGQSPSKTTYFQPVLDAIDYAPSKLEFSGPAVFVEGKTDYYMFEYFRQFIFPDLYEFRFIPSSSANDIGPLISLYLGWGLQFLVLTDDDKAGQSACKKYREEWFLDEDTVTTLSSASSVLKGKKLEGLLSNKFKDGIRIQGGHSKLSKKTTARYFQEHFAKELVLIVDSPTKQNVKNILDFCRSKFSPR